MPALLLWINQISFQLTLWTFLSFPNFFPLSPSALPKSQLRKLSAGIEPFHYSCTISRIPSLHSFRTTSSLIYRLMCLCLPSSPYYFMIFGIGSTWRKHAAAAFGEVCSRPYALMSLVLGHRFSGYGMICWRSSRFGWILIVSAHIGLILEEIVCISSWTNLEQQRFVGNLYGLAVIWI